MNDQAGEKESDHEGAAEVQLGLVMPRGLLQAEKEKKATDEERRIVRGDHRPGKKHEVQQSEQRRHRGVFVHPGDGGLLGFFLLGLGGKRREFLAEDQEINGRVEQDCENGMGAECFEHEERGPVPAVRARDHQHRRSGEICQHATHADVHKEQAESGVFEGFARLEFVNFPAQEERGDGHRARFGDEGPQQRSEDKDGQPPGRGGASAKCGHQTQGAFGKLHDRPGGGDGHDHHHKHRLREGAVQLHEGNNISPAVMIPRHPQDRNRPNGKDRLHLSEEFQHSAPQGHLGVGLETLAHQALPMPFFHTMRQLQQHGCQKRMENGTGKKHADNQIERQGPGA